MKNTILQTINSRVIRYLPLFGSILAIIFLCYLGIWQLNRGFEKEQMQAQLTLQQARYMLTEDDLKSASENSLNYRKLTITGQFLNQYTLLLDNQMHKGQVGYHVLVPFEWKAGNWILVNQGWVQAPNSRAQLPNFTTITGTVVLVGTLRRPANNRMIKDMLESKTLVWPLRIQKIDLNEIVMLIPGKSMPYILYTDVNPAQHLEPVLLPEAWLTPERHFGYAVQWFLLSLALIVVVICVAWRRK